MKLVQIDLLKTSFFVVAISLSAVAYAAPVNRGGVIDHTRVDLRMARAEAQELLMLGARESGRPVFFPRTAVREKKAREWRRPARESGPVLEKGSGDGSRETAG